MNFTQRGRFILIALLYLFPGVFAGAQAYTSIVVFGDSLSDTGNAAFQSKSKYGVGAQVPGPATGYTDGRFTDGTDTVPAAHNFTGVWIEQLAAALPAHPAVKNSLAGGTNYAYGFATTDVGTNLFTYGPGNALSFTVNNVGQQISDYLATNPTITNKTLFVVWAGANDLIAATTSAQIVAAAQRDATNVQRLINAGATDIIVPNLPPLGLVPRFNGSATTSVPANAAAAGFDQALAAYLGALPAANPGKTLHIFQFDVYTFFNTIVGPPIVNGLANVTMSAQGNSAINPDTYLFWDDLHPTTGGHSLVASAALTLIGTPVTTTTAVTSTNYNANLGSAVTLTAKVTGTSGTPMGTVTFYDGTNALSSGLVFGSTSTTSVSYTTTALAAGTHSITAQFAGVNGYVSSTSSAVAEIVTAPAYSSAFSPASITIASGQSGTSTLTLTPVGGYSASTVTFGCGSLPAHIACSFSPATVALNGSNTPVSTVLTVSTSASAGLLLPARPGSTHMPEVVTAFSGLGFLGLAAFRRRRKGLRGISLAVVLLMLSGAAAVGLTGCGSSNNAQSGTYTVHANMIANGVTSYQDLTVIVQ